MTTRNRWRRLIPWLILWLAFGLRLYRLDFQSIWWDEGHSIFVASHPISRIPTLPAMDVHPPAYFALLQAWMAVAGRSEFALRYLSVLFSLLTVALLWRFAASITRPFGPVQVQAAAGLVALLAALSPLFVAYAQEVRSYAMFTCLALVSTYALWQILLAAPAATGRRWPALILYILSTAACLYTHYFTIFLLLFQNPAWLIWVANNRMSVILDRSPAIGGQRSASVSRLTLWLGTQVAILLLFTPQLLLALRQVTGYTNPNLTPPRLSEFLSRSWQAYTVGLTIDPTPARWGMWLLLLILLASWLIVLIFTIRHPSRSFPIPVSQLTTPAQRPPGRASASAHHSPHLQFAQAQRLLIRTFLFLLAWFLLPLMAYFVILQHQPSFEPRYVMLVTPALFLLLALGITFAVRTAPLPLRVTFYTLPLAILLFSLHSYYTNQTYFKDDSAGLAAWLARQTTADDIVYLDVPHPMHYYARRIPAPTRYLFADIHTVAGLLTREAAGRDRLFWVTWRGSDTDPRRVIPFLAEKYGQQLGQQDFRGYRVTWYSLPSAGTIVTLPDTLTPSQATFGDVLRLDGVAYGGSPPQGTSIRGGEPIWATLHFTLLRETEIDYRVSLRLVAADGSQIAQVDRDLLNDRHFRTSAWPLADPALNQAINVYTLPLPADTPPGSYRLQVLVYNARPPYPSEGVSDHESGDGVAAILGNLTVLP